MILRIELENFYSIKDSLVIDFRAAKINTAKTRELKNNVFEWNGTPILKSIGLFGPNASGKSNIISAISICCRIILDSHLNVEGGSFNFEPFKFEGYSNKPSRFLIDFVCNNVEYEYSFELTKTEILKESLYYYPQGRRARLFTRDESAEKPYIFAEGAFTKPADVVASTSKVNLFLSRACSMNRDKAVELYGYFMNTFLLRVIPMNNLQVAETYFKKYRDLLLAALQCCDSDIVNIDLVKNKIRSQQPIATSQSSFEIVETEIGHFVTYHKFDPAVPFDMDRDESTGTKELFGLLLSLLDVVRNRKALMADEFDDRLHTRLADFVIDMIHASECSQFLFSSHNTNLIDSNHFRRDQIVFVNKKEDGSTESYSLYDFKDFRDTMDAEKAYIQGRFDAVPYTDTSVNTLKRLLGD